MLQSMGSQRPGHELATEQQQLVTIFFVYLLKWVYWFILCMDYIMSLLQNFSFFLIFAAEAIIDLEFMFEISFS